MQLLNLLHKVQFSIVGTAYVLYTVLSVLTSHSDKTNNSKNTKKEGIMLGKCFK
jgi:hypothetical protein